MERPAIAIIQARMSSSRLPGKVLKPLAGKPVIRHIYDRAKSCSRVDKVIVATSRDKSDDPLAEYCEVHGLDYYRGSLDNVMSRFVDILNEHGHPYFVRITGDCPLIHPPFIDEQINALLQFGADVVWSNNESTLLEGQGVRSTRSLLYINDRSSDPADLEHAGSVYLAEHPGEFKIVEIELPEEFVRTDIRLTIDEEKDYLIFTEIFNAFQSMEHEPELRRVVDWLDKNRQIASINRDVSHRELNLKLRKIRKTWSRLDKAGKIRLNI